MDFLNKLELSDQKIHDALMKEVIFDWSYYCFKFYVCNYVLFVRISNGIDMQINQWYICNYC